MREEEVPFKVALHEAQVLGYAEADPTDDISGKDAFRKLMILSALAFGTSTRLARRPDCWD